MLTIKETAESPKKFCNARFGKFANGTNTLLKHKDRYIV